MFPVPPGTGLKALSDVPLGPSFLTEEHGSMPFAFKQAELKSLSDIKVKRRKNHEDYIT